MDDLVITVLIVGFVAQLIDGSLSMGYGVASSSMLLGLGLPPATASACVHLAEVFTTGVSGIFHLKIGNVDRSLFWKLALPGVIGAVLGAYVLTALPASTARPFVAVYLLIAGVVIIRKALTQTIEKKKITDKIVPLGLVGGFLDASGGGGWGPIVASNLVARGRKPRKAIGSAILAEFFVALAASLTFLAIVGFREWKILACLVVGGVLAAPLGAYMCRRIPARVVMIIIGLLVIVFGLRAISLAFSL